MAAILKKIEKITIFATASPILTKFGMVMHLDFRT